MHVDVLMGLCLGLKGVKCNKESIPFLWRRENAIPPSEPAGCSTLSSFVIWILPRHKVSLVMLIKICTLTITEEYYSEVCAIRCIKFRWFRPLLLYVIWAYNCKRGSYREKKSKGMLGYLAFCNADGRSHMTLIVIGNAARLGCFKKTHWGRIWVWLPRQQKSMEEFHAFFCFAARFLCWNWVVNTG